ncbi:hypothetical protein AAC387_Pa02g4445 [Persea americana]
MAIAIYKRVVWSDHTETPSEKEPMAMMRGKMAMVVILLAALVMGSGIVGSRADGLCNIPIKGLMSCKPSVSGPEGVVPTTECCSALAMANWSCLCAYRFYMPTYGIDPARAMQLPSKCNLPVTVKC